MTFGVRSKTSDKIEHGNVLRIDQTVIESLESLNILDEVTGAERNRRYVFKEYLDLFR
jgi:hypothetical protein